jgi:hypothetical protein
MTNLTYLQGAISVGATATLVCTVTPENDGVLVQNSGTAAVFLGGSTVTATGTTQGIQLAASASMTVPSVGGLVHDLFAVTASGTSTVAFLIPETS